MFFPFASSHVLPAASAGSQRGRNTCPHSSIWKPFLWAILITIRLHAGNGCWKRLPRALNRKVHATVFERREVKHCRLSVASLKVSVFPCRKINPTGGVVQHWVARYTSHLPFTPELVLPLLICKEKGKDFTSA